MKKITLKKKIAGLVSVAMLAIAVVVPVMANPKTADAWTCQDQNVIHCGVNSKPDMINQINNGDGVHNDIKSKFSLMGIYTDDLANQNTLGGVVTRDGRVILANGQQVASNVVIGERATPARTGTPWAGLIWNYVPNAFGPAVPQQGAYVYMYNGQFQYAVVVSCGNPVLKSLNGIPPHTTISKEVRNVTQDPNGTTYAETVSANPGDIVRFRIRVYNNATVTAELVHIGDQLPNYLTVEPGSAQTTTQQLVGNTWQAVTTNISDNEVTQGRNVGNLIPNQDAYLIFNARVANVVPAGCHTLVNTGYTDSNQTNPITDTANVTVCLQIQAKYTITVKKFNDINGNGQKEDNEGFLSGWTFTANGSEFQGTKTTDGNGSLTFNELDGGQYTITEQMQSGWRNTTPTSQIVSVGPNQTILFGNQRTVSPPTPPVTPPVTPPTVTSQPTSLPASGPVEAAGGVMGTGALGYAGYLWRKSRKTLLSTLKNK